jgi:EAL domain-containing protein (putative c-di-GMP-specific phosphodiesterase class I)
LLACADAAALRSGRSELEAAGFAVSAQLRILREHGCVWMQGYLFSMPEPPHELRRAVEARDGTAFLADPSALVEA